MVRTTPITELDFARNKEALKNFLKAQDRFRDYDFEGSNLNVLLDILAYNTFYNNFYTNMAISEMFLDSAQLRSSVVSHAKALNYLPRSYTCARAKINITFDTGSDTPENITIPPLTRFISEANGRQYSFYTLSPTIVFNNEGSYTFTGLDIYEGFLVEESFTVTEEREILLNNDQIDISTIRVYVKESANAPAETEVQYEFKENLFGVESTDPVFYLQAESNGQYAIHFGQNTFGNEPSVGNVVRITYLRSNGTLANNLTSFSRTSAINGYDVASVSLNSRSEGGAESETTESIRFFAPKTIQVQERAITESDYTILLKNQFPEIQAISTYGGEEENPPRYGRVIVAVDVNNADGVSATLRNRYQQFIAQRSPLTIEPIIVPAQFMYAEVTTNINYNASRSTTQVNNIINAARTKILNYSTNFLSDFGKTLRYSKICAEIDSSDVAVLSNETSLRAIIEINPLTGVTENFAVNFKQALKRDERTSLNLSRAYRPAIQTSQFTFDATTVYIEDNGNGVLQIIGNSSDGFVVLKNIGTVDYTTGEVKIEDILIESFVGSAIKVYANLLNNDIASPKQRILTIRAEDINITAEGVIV